MLETESEFREEMADDDLLEIPAPSPPQIDLTFEDSRSPPSPPTPPQEPEVDTK